ncbi:hypothetical protein BTO06_10275 [Tenacibaculum sp. SZ-18]|uniref:hypothetical protein n=1 Tax=Tenacibaculum sp. SZ-18 TaxID=754423 RepID=UPI000C2D1919|nr:hypothetical protein [Tenacibaculum sp. SZ-18]AUC15502.1 hypothetical protein BTO06_10275 [Tenacibaculum sp. SZ-18]
MRILNVLILIIPSLLMCQEFSFDVNTNEGFIESVYILDGNRVIKISESIDEIYQFKSSSRAKDFLQNRDYSSIPKNKYQVGETTIFMNSVSSVEYYTSNTSSGLSGQIKSINNLTFTYAPDNSWNKNSGVVGKLTKIGNVSITYWTSAGYTERGRYRGKIKSLGGRQFQYEGWSNWGEKARIVGKLTSIGKLKINYYETDYDRGYKGKLKSIGKVKFVYYGETRTNSKANIVGKFKQRLGKDLRLTIH